MVVGGEASPVQLRTATTLSDSEVCVPRIRAESIEEHKTLTRRQILDAATGLFRMHGYTATNLGDIAAYVGIGRTTLYEYFTDKEDILVSLVEAEMPGVMDRMLSNLPPTISCRDHLGELIVRGLEFVSTDNDLGSMIMRELPSLSRQGQMRARRAHGKLAKAVTDACRDGIERGEFRRMDPEDAGRLVYTIMMSAGQGLMRSAEAEDRFEEVARTVVSLVFDGIAIDSGAPPPS
jgi:AcrR family transcriptional regulator